MISKLNKANSNDYHDFEIRLTDLIDKIKFVKEKVSHSAGYLAASGHIDYQIAAFFAEYIEWELTHPNQTKEMLMANEIFKDDNRGPVKGTGHESKDEEPEKRYRFHIDYELKSSMEILDQALTRFDKNENWPDVPEIKWNEICFEKGFFRHKGRPVFSGGFNIMQRRLLDPVMYPDWVDKEKQDIDSFLKKMQVLGVGILSTHVRVLDLLMTDGSVDSSKVKSMVEKVSYFGQMGFKVDILFGWQTDRVFLDNIWPGITEFYGNFFDLDIDHPETKILIERIMDAVLPALSHLPEIITWDLANEPFFTPDLWSQHTLEKYHSWLADKYGTIGDLNQVWKTDFSQFEAIPQPRDQEGTTCSPGEWFDRITFNNSRVASFFEYLKGLVLRYVPHAVIHLKGQDNSSLGPRSQAVSEGINREFLSPITDLHGVDTRPLPVTEPRMAAGYHGNVRSEIMPYDESIYGFHWLGQSFLYDYLTSLEPRQNIIDFEYHAFSINAIRIPDIPQSHSRATLWLAHLHGLVSSMTWYWHRRFGPAPAPNDRYKMWFYGSISTQPLLASEYFQTLLKMNIFSRDVEALSSPSSRPIRILISNSSYIHNQAHIIALHRVYEGSCFHGLPIGFVTEDSLCTNGITDDCEIIIIPDVEYISQMALSKLEHIMKTGIQLIRFGELSPRFDAHGIPLPAAVTVFLENLPVIGYATAKDLSRQLESYISHLVSRNHVIVEVLEENGAFGVMHRIAQTERGTVILLINVTKGDLSIGIKEKEGAAIKGFDLLNGEEVNGDIISLSFQGVRLIRLFDSDTKDKF
jgi:hypothetical protein